MKDKKGRHHILEALDITEDWLSNNGRKNEVVVYLSFLG